MKRLTMLFSVMLIAAMLLAACATPAPTEAPAEPEAPVAEAPATEAPAEPEAPAAGKTVLNVWSFTNEIMTMAVAFEGKHPDVDVVYTMIPMTNGEYQTKLMATLGTDAVPDVVALEAAFVKSYVESDFLPYLSGERTPHPDPLARGAFIGLTLRHGRGALTRAVLEGVAFGLKDGFTLIQQAGLTAATEIRASGGGTKGKLWRQILSSVLNAELVTVNTSEGAAFGAALLAGVGAGCWPDVPNACRQTIQVTGRTSPNDQDAGVYQEAYQVYRELYPALRSSFARMH
jgi:glycerol kinase